MTNYNDGEWHFWNGGECPVHPKTMIEFVYHDGAKSVGYNKCCAGPHDDTYAHAAWERVIRFRVVIPYVEPKPPLEHWSVYFGDMIGGSWTDEGAARSVAEQYLHARVVHMREVQG
jgi:hypothetical protein